MNVFLGLSVIAAFFGVPVVGWIMYSRAQTRRYNANLMRLAERFGLQPADDQNLGWEWMRVEGTYRGFEVSLGAKVESHYRADSITGIGTAVKMTVPEATIEEFRMVKNHGANRLSLGDKVVPSGDPHVDDAALILCSDPTRVPLLIEPEGKAAALVLALWKDCGTYRNLFFSEGEFYFTVSSYFRPKLDEEVYGNAIELMAEIAQRLTR